MYNKYARGIYNTIFRIVQHSAEAEDILQETFVNVFHDLNTLRDEKNLGAWVKQIAIHKSMTVLRKRKLRFSDFEGDTLENSEEDTIDERDFQFKVDIILKAINQLPEGYRLIVQLYLLENISQGEIANLMGISHVTVRTQYHRAKKKIVELIKKEF